MTEQIYLHDTYLSSCAAVISFIGTDEKGSYVILDRTVFYPQGGGQPSDIGTLEHDGFNVDVISVRQVDDEIRHYIDSANFALFQGANVICNLNIERRLLNARYHTAAHLLGNVVENLYSNSKAIKGHSFPNESYVEFFSTDIIDLGHVSNELEVSIKSNKKTSVFETDPVSFESNFYRLPYSVPENKAFRVIQIGDFLPVPCGGTHVKEVGEIGLVTLLKIKVKNDICRISYILN